MRTFHFYSFLGWVGLPQAAIFLVLKGLNVLWGRADLFEMVMRIMSLEVIYAIALLAVVHVKFREEREAAEIQARQG